MILLPGVNWQHLETFVFVKKEARGGYGNLKSRGCCQSTGQPGSNRSIWSTVSTVPDPSQAVSSTDEETGAQRGTGPKPYCESDRVRIRISRAPHQPLQPSAPKTPVTDKDWWQAGQVEGLRTLRSRQFMMAGLGAFGRLQCITPGPA